VAVSAAKCYIPYRYDGHRTSPYRNRSRYLRRSPDELERTAARIVWVRRTREAHREANDALTTAWMKLADRLWKPLDDVRRRDLWPRHLYWSL